MLDVTHGALYIAPAVLSYATFVFSSELINPFTSPHTWYRRRAWKLGRRLALGVLFGGYLAAGLLLVSGLNWILSVAAGCVVFLLVFLVAIRSYYANNALSIVEKSQNTRMSTQLHADVDDVGETPGRERVSAPVTERGG